VNESDSKNLPASIQARLMNQALKNSRGFNELLQYYAIERFLYRLGRSHYANQFILKGALLFRLWGLQVSRPTRDIDLLGQTGNDLLDLVAIIREICELDFQEDGVRFDPTTVRGVRIQEGAGYEGVRLRFSGLLGKARLHLQLDIGFDDVITPAPVRRDYPAMLSMPMPELRSYPPETMVAEKLQSMIYLGSVNSRMKDFYDIWFVSEKLKFKGILLQEAIQQTFGHRKTSIPAQEPTAFSAQFAREKQSQWKAFLKTNGIVDGPDQMEILLDHLRSFVLPIYVTSKADKIFKKVWNPGGPWK
jgi:hypothetical protein